MLKYKNKNSSSSILLYSIAIVDIHLVAGLYNKLTDDDDDGSGGDSNVL